MGNHLAPSYLLGATLSSSQASRCGPSPSQSSIHRVQVWGLPTLKCTAFSQRWGRAQWGPCTARAIWEAEAPKGSATHLPKQDLVRDWRRGGCSKCLLVSIGIN